VHHEELRQQAIDTALAYLRAQSTRGYTRELRESNQATVMRLRDSLIYRSEAAIWHLVLMSRLQVSALERLRSTLSEPNAPHDIMHSSAREQQFAFDDVVFNTIAIVEKQITA
jgi:hypothetical protein